MRLGSSMRRRRSGRSGEDGGEGKGLRLAGISVAVVLVGFGLGWVAATQILFPAPPPPGDLFEVPDVRGEELERAVQRLDEGGLSLGSIHGLRHPEADSGVVVGQSPLAGQLATPNAPVRVTISLGPERRPVPEVSRLRADWARNVLQAAGFTVAVDSVESDVPTGRVLEVDPPEGTRMTIPGEVRMVVSRGPPRFEMPLLLGMTEEQARDTLSVLGLEVGRVEEVFRFGRDQGIVIEQAPSAETIVQRGSAVRLSVGRRSGGNGDSGGNKEPPTP